MFCRIIGAVPDLCHLPQSTSVCFMQCNSLQELSGVGRLNTVKVFKCPNIRFNDMKQTCLPINTFVLSDFWQMYSASPFRLCHRVEIYRSSVTDISSEPHVDGGSCAGGCQTACAA